MTAGYRADNLRAWKQTAAGRTYYYYDDGVPILETDNTGTATAQNVFAPDGLVARYQGSTWIYYTFDQQGNVSQRLDVSGTVLSTSTFDAYGAESSSGSPSDPFGYNAACGYMEDRETGLYYCHNRYYDPSTGRWINRDPIGFRGGINKYAYAGGRVVGAIDPSGLESELGLPAALNDVGADPVAVERGATAFQELLDKIEAPIDWIKNELAPFFPAAARLGAAGTTVLLAAARVDPNTLQTCADALGSAYPGDGPMRWGIAQAEGRIGEGENLPPTADGRNGSPQWGAAPSETRTAGQIVRFGYRVDSGHVGDQFPDEEKQAHINWWNWSGGKGNQGTISLPTNMPRNGG